MPSEGRGRKLESCRARRYKTGTSKPGDSALEAATAADAGRDGHGDDDALTGAPYCLVAVTAINYRRFGRRGAIMIRPTRQE